MHIQSWSILEKAQLPGEQSKAILEVMELEMNSRWDQAVLKGELENLRLATKSDIDLFRAEFHEECRATRAEFKAVRQEVKAELQLLRQEMAMKFATKDDLNAAIHSMRNWVIGLFFGQMAISVGLLMGAIYFFEAHGHR